MNNIAKNKNSVAQSKNRLPMAGRLALFISAFDTVQALLSLHGSLEELVERVYTLNQLERHGDQEQLLQLDIDRVACMTLACGAKSRHSGRKTACDDNDVEQVPSVGSEALEPQSVEANENVDGIEDCQEKEYPVCKGQLWKRTSAF